MISQEFWKNKRVFLTGHTGFKGSWLSIWLHRMGAKVTGFSLKPPTDPSLYDICDLNSSINSVIGDIRDKNALLNALHASEAEIVIHMAAQPLVRYSYKEPVETYETNVLGTLYLMESIRTAVSNGQQIKSVLNVTTDKCYDNKEWEWGYRENEPLGGYDPYSSSKACSELVTSSYRNSYFNPTLYNEHGVAIASARAGNVIGGGDWAEDRLIPDCVRSLVKGDPIIIRNPLSIRPWQHVLEPLSGYLMLSENLYRYGIGFAEAWNFGPNEQDAQTVEWIVNRMCNLWGREASYVIDTAPQLHEANYLKLDCSKAKKRLGWQPKWNLETAIEKIVFWNQEYMKKSDVYELCARQIDEYMALCGGSS
ncbi:CDP-glucose 4,6-dehydratase [Paenibacillus sp. GCM10027626]|uniref:CDP-glucose 4,6-dehydratase n=1 Tax=Paenibacillus sp. GCM10027626 TaxID=3273411 RepID=UPI00362958CB